MGDETFDEKSLTEKLSKLNGSQQSIESLSRWCVSHRKKAKHVVETWDKLFKSAQREQRVSLLYLSNDILQNSRRKGSEFVNEFWKVLPAALKDVYDGDDNSRKVASRLVDIWEERKVFGSRGQNLKNEMLGKNPSPINPVKSLNPIKVVKRDSTSLRVKLPVGSFPERILTAFQLVYDDVGNEEAALNKFDNAVSCVQEIEKEVVSATSQGNLNASDIVDTIQKQENMILQCTTDLANSEVIRVALVSQLREALQEQESKLEHIRSKIDVAHGQIQQAANVRLQLTSSTSTPPTVHQMMNEPVFSSAPPPGINASMPVPTHPLMSFTKSSEEESKKATAAAVAAKLAASTSSAQMLTSILSSLVAEEAASMSSGLKRPKLEAPMPFDAKNPDGSNSAYFPIAQHAVTHMPPVQPSSTQSTSQVNPLQAPFLPPPPPPLPLGPPAASPANQFVQPNLVGLPYGFGPSNLPPLSSNAAMGFARPGPPAQQAPLQQPQNEPSQSPQAPPQQPPGSGGYYRPIGIGFYGQSHQPPTPPIHRQ